MLGGIGRVKIVEVGMFAKVKDTTLSEYGVKKDDIVYVAGDAIVNTTEKDPYALRRLFVAAFVEDNHIQHQKKPFMVDGKRLEPVSEGKQKKLDAVKEADFGEKGNATTH